MYQTIELEIRDRLNQSKELISHISSLETVEQSSDLLKIQKGFLFISMYSSIEYTITSVVSRFLELIKQEELKPMEFKKYLLCTVLDSKFNALLGSSKKMVWHKKKELFDALFSSEPAVIDDSVFPTDGINISQQQIEDIWQIFHLSGEAIPTGVNTWILKEIKDHRNAIAHGREKAVTIGGRYTAQTLMQRVADVETLCFHIVAGFESLTVSKAYKYSGVA
ncbi:MULTISPECIES: MAE_28990/MAE_18760 family HEPN-like nuclease [Marinomonas]|uniref:HEPN domain-containing protein n=1 Tax=Marinomonas rhodophyticola TaxID=2992803 RepID=A0ABT3KHI3_9GAMM|nr:MAE_28990/MAE_18760 family HEPN-like nuclease [Marinomonas sp. KJ51-3]MCW4629975.1 HEPN domain-containing protein [Marinomonas sp. KJ51-3]